MKRYRSIHLDSDIDENAELDVDDLMGEDIFLRAELGFFGVAVLTAVQTPLFCGEDASVGLFCKEL